MKRKLFLAAIAVLIVSLMAFGTLSYFTAEGKAKNVITMGNIAIELHEENADGTEFPVDGIVGAMPGMSYDKVVYVENTSEYPAWVRVKVDKDEVFAPVMSMNFDLEHWTYSDGYYYYNIPLEGGAMTEKLFTEVTFDGSMDNSFAGQTAYVTVTAEAVQSANNGTSCLDVVGWPSAK